MKKIFIIFSLLILVFMVVGAGCGEKSGNTAGGGDGAGFADVFGKGNAKCTGTDGNVEVMWWIKNQDYKVIAKENGIQQATIVKKGDYVYMIDQTGKCSFYNIKELEKLFGNKQQQSPAENIESTVEAYKRYNFNCVPGIVTDADITKPSGTCEDLTKVMKEAIQQACNTCQQNPQAFGGDCSQYCP